jgi:hypothetical protein
METSPLPYVVIGGARRYIPKDVLTHLKKTKTKRPPP